MNEERPEVATLQEHDKRSDERATWLGAKIDKIEQRGDIMTEPVNVKNIFETGNPMSGMIPALMGNTGSGAGVIGGGLGAGVLGGILGGILLNRNGVLGGGGDGAGIVTPAMLATSLGTVTDTLNNSTVLQTLGDIKAAIPYNEAQVQLALAGAQADINNHSATNAAANAVGFAATQRYIGDSLATAIAGQGEIKTAIAAQAANILAANNLLSTQLANSTFQLATTVTNDGDKTRALIIHQNEAMLNRQLATAEAALLEQRSIGRSRDVEVNVTQSVTQNQNQLQMQAQQQQQFQILANLAANVSNLANDIQVVRQTQSNINFGTQTGSNQNANASNTKVN